MLYKKARERKSAGADRRRSQGALSQVHSSADQANFLRPVRTTPQLRSLSDFQGPTSASSSSTKRRVCNFRVFCLQERFSGAARLSRAPKNARCSAKAPPCLAAYFILRSCRRTLGAPILYFTANDVVDTWSILLFGNQIKPNQKQTWHCSPC